METKNLIRQNFISEDIGQNKAQVLADRYSLIYPHIKVSFIPKYATYSEFDSKYLPDNKYPEEFFMDIKDMGIGSNDIVINLVDNEGFKKKLDVFVNVMKNFYFSAGVNLYNGQVYFSCSENTNGYVHDHADLLNIFDEVSVHACADTDANGSDDNPEQLFNGNDLCASILANLYQTVLTDIPLYKKIHFVSGTNLHVSCGSPNFSLLNYWIKRLDIKDEDLEYRKARQYVARQGLDKTTKSAEYYYKIYREGNTFHEFSSILDAP